MSLKEMLAAQRATERAVPVTTPPPPAERQLGAAEPGTELLPLHWPYDPACCAASDLTVMVERDGSGWVGIHTPEGRFMYLMGPLKAIHIPY